MNAKSKGGSMGTISFCTVFSSSDEDDEEEEFSNRPQKLQFSNNQCKIEPNTEISSNLPTKSADTSQIDRESKTSKSSETPDTDVTSKEAPETDVTSVDVSSTNNPNKFSSDQRKNSDFSTNSEANQSFETHYSDNVPTSPARVVLTMSPYSGNRQIAKVMPYLGSLEEAPSVASESQVQVTKQGFLSICPPPELLPVLGLLEQYMTPTLDAAVQCSSRAGSDLGRKLDRFVK